MKTRRSRGIEERAIELDMCVWGGVLQNSLMSIARSLSEIDRLRGEAEKAGFRPLLRVPDGLARDARAALDYVESLDWLGPGESGDAPAEFADLGEVS